MLRYVNNTEYREQAYALASAIKMSQGSIDYLDDVSKQLTTKLLTFSKYNPMTVNRGNGPVEYIPVRKDIAPFKRRKVDKEALRRAYPAVYEAAVSITPPVRKYAVRLEAAPGTRKSQEWAEIAAIAAAKTQARFQKKFEFAEWKLSSTNAQALLEVKGELTGLRGAITRSRNELAEFIEAHGLPTIIDGRNDGRIVARATGPTYTINYDVVEQHPGARNLVGATACAGYSFIDFDKTTKFDPEGDQDPFEGD